MRAASDPDATLLQFLQTTYRAAAGLAAWDRRLDGEVGVPGRRRPVSGAPASAPRT
ncbi:MAG TPA: DUF5996 family protein [Ramlibacter sp.]|nr:DUF5996 family protein [Ramlibacter sp.]